MHKITIPPSEPSNLEQWLWYIKHYEDTIYVREKNKKGKWKVVNLKNVSPRTWSQYVTRWLEQGIVPARVAK